MDATARNVTMVARIEQQSVCYPVRFVVAGDSGAWPDPTADGIFAQLVQQIDCIDPSPLFFANLGDFAGPGTRSRHHHYLRLVERMSTPNICVIGNHDLDDPSGPETFAEIHGPMNFTFSYGHTRFLALHSEPGIVGELDVPGLDTTQGSPGPRAEDLTFLDEALAAAPEPHRVVLMHMPPHMNGHFAPHEDWGFKQAEDQFFDLLRQHRVALVCCAHGLAFDTYVHRGTRFIMSGGGGAGLCSHMRGVCTAGKGRPEDRGSLFHATEIAISEDGGISGRVIQAFQDPNAPARISFGP